MPGRSAGHPEFSAKINDVDGRDKPGHDGALMDRFWQFFNRAPRRL
jgi:hypothetical protein